MTVPACRTPKSRLLTTIHIPPKQLAKCREVKVAEGKKEEVGDLGSSLGALKTATPTQGGDKVLNIHGSGRSE
jgi:hypothetical protein